MSGRASSRILLAASEVVGFAKTGGLADVVGSLPVALSQRGHPCAVILPLYHSAHQAPIPPEPTDLAFTLPVGKQMMSGRLWRSALPGSAVPVFLVEQPDFFGRDDPEQGKGIYQYTRPDGTRVDYPDNCQRFSFFSRAILEAIRLLDYWPDVLHVNDWQTGLVPVYLRELAHGRGMLPELLDRYASIRTLCTIHNIVYQGVFDADLYPTTGLPRRLYNDRQLEFYGRLNFLKGGIVFSDLLNTVSPTYAHEIQTPYFGQGLHGVLSERRSKLYGIVNGVDYTVWDPQTDPHLPAHYCADALLPGKGECKAHLQKTQGLNVDPQAPLLAVVARLVEQKGPDLICEAAPTFLGEGAQLIVLGEGERNYIQKLEVLRERFPGQVSLTFQFTEALAHQIEAGADVFLMPSLFEPSGLSQLYSMRYGTPPVVRTTGGLADTVVDTTPETLHDGTATGFRFQAHSAEALLEAIRRALSLYHTPPSGHWLQVIRTGMQQDWSWDRSAAEYVRLYEFLGSRP